MDRRVLSGEDAVARLQERQAAFQKTVAATQEMATRMRTLTATASDANGLTTVTVDSSGVLLKADFSARIQRTTPEAVSRALMEALAYAKQRVAEQTQAVIAETVGADSDTGRAVAQDLQARLGGRQ
ncbi:YbaB/EbfC family nucleoid-associated protein [Glycomyces niveus]|uniref:YbaB/EbfC family nucleoid-associated protein n=1 Tax=Glycomyces niveus TaxID=2820287 RepID=A0ABS3U3W0_9ACTN|nr:YbaB/EbfC family nucleoid-associated protein [Glycomyces sp. NEAU-S30]MBO3733462.1 YbaB/EbfC family nucleoid-associated protein [Glycomyces sp. NEAU-S30]